MAYPYFPQYQMQYQPPMADQLAQLRQQQYQNPVPQQQTQGGMIWVPNEMAAHEYLVAPNNAVALWDSNNPVIYLKQADASGKPTMKIYDLVERNTAPVQASKPQGIEYVTRKEFDALTARIDALTATESKKEETKDA